MNLKNIILYKEARCKRVHTFHFHNVCTQAKLDCSYLGICIEVLKLGFFYRQGNNFHKIHNSDYLPQDRIRKLIVYRNRKMGFFGMLAMIFFYTGVHFVIFENYTYTPLCMEDISHSKKKIAGGGVPKTSK